MHDAGRRLLSLASAAAGTGALVAAGRPPLGARGLAAPPLLHPATLPTWWAATGAVDATFAGLRVVGVLAGGYLVVVLAVWSMAEITGSVPLQRFAVRLTPPALRATVALVAGVTLAAAPAGAAMTPARSSPAPAPATAGVAGPARAASALAPATAGVTTPAGSAPAPATVPAPTIHPAPGPRPASSVHRDPAAPAVWVVRPGDSFWGIAAARVGGTSPEAVAPYWLRLMAANADRLPLRGDPDLLFVGDRVLLPPL